METQKTAPYAHWQNGKAERRVRTLEDSATAILAGSSLPKSFWAEATSFAQYVRNRSPTSTLPDGVTPYECMHGQKPDISGLRTFGCKGYAWLAPEKRKKGDNRREEVIMLGYEQGRKGWWCITPSGRRTFYSDVIWEENVQGKLAGRPVGEKVVEANRGGGEQIPEKRRSSRIAALKDASATRVNPKSVAGVCAYLHLDTGIESMVCYEMAAQVMGEPLEHLQMDSSWDDEHTLAAADMVFLATRADQHRFV